MERISPQKRQDESLVSEQNGFLISIIGLAIALVIGVAFKTHFSDRNISFWVSETLEQIDSPVQIRFERASLSLARGALPQLSLIVEGMVIDSSDPCLLSPLISVNRMNIPLSLGMLTSGQIRLSSARMDTLEIHLRGQLDQCQTKRKVASVGAKGASRRDDQAALFKRNFEGAVDKLSVHLMRLSWAELPKSSFEVRNVTYNKASGERKLSGQLRLFNLVPLQTTALIADLQLKENANKDLTGSLRGHWREGRYQIDLDRARGTESIHFSGQMSHVPMSELLSYAHNELKLEGLNLWISAGFKGLIDLSDPQSLNSSLEFNKIDIEGDGFEARSPRLSLKLGEEISFEPFAVDVGVLELSDLAQVLGQESLPPGIGALGSISGQLNFKEARRFDFQGQWSGVELVFSNKGKRERQQISFNHFAFARDQRRITLEASKPLDAKGEESFQGQINYQGLSDFSQADLKIDFDNFKLLPEVETLITNGGHLAPLSGHLRGQARGLQIIDIHGEVSAEGARIEELELEKIYVGLEAQDEATKYQLRVGKLSFPKGSQVFEFIKGEFPETLLQNEAVHLNSVRGQFVQGDQLSWSNLKADISRSSHILSSQGEWSPKQGAHFQVSLSGPEIQKQWLVQGLPGSLRLESLLK